MTDKEAQNDLLKLRYYARNGVSCSLAERYLEKFKKLEPPCQQAMVGYYIFGFSYAEIAKWLHYSKASIIRFIKKGKLFIVELCKKCQ